MLPAVRFMNPRWFVLLVTACWCSTAPALAQDDCYSTASKPSQAVASREIPSQTAVQTTDSDTITPATAQATIPPPAIDMKQLIARLKKTSAIGFFTKLALRSDAIDLQRDIRHAIAQGAMPSQRQTLRQRFDGLVIKILALLDQDPPLARDIFRARESIWISLIQLKTSKHGGETA